MGGDPLKKKSTTQDKAFDPDVRGGQTIIVSVLVFGGLWGFWGVFFAIPLATLVSAVIHAWPRIETSTEA